MTFHDEHGWAEHASCFNKVQVQDGDIISIDASSRQMNMHVTDAELQKRREAWTAPPYKSTQGTLYKYIKCVSSASLGCVTDL